ncbi:MAG: M48 family metalloprotease [Novosphingobium sp.]
MASRSFAQTASTAPLRRVRKLLSCAAAIVMTVVPCYGVGLAAPDQAWPLRLREDMVRLAAIEWQLRSAAADSCPAHAADTGLVIDDRRAYGRNDWPLLAKTLGLQDDPVVIGVVAGGPADRAGLREGDAILSIGGKTVATIVERRRAGPLVAEALIEEIAESGTDASPLAIAVRRKGETLQYRVKPARHCSARLVLVTQRGVDAHSDSRNVAISTGLIAFARNDDEIALAAGHELAHIILRHRKGGAISARRLMEDDADSLGLRLMHCAGYDAARSFGLFQRLGKGDWLGFLRAPTHRSFAKRVARLQSELPGLSCPVGSGTVEGLKRLRD